MSDQPPEYGWSPHPEYGWSAQPQPQPETPQPEPPSPQWPQQPVEAWHGSPQEQWAPQEQWPPQPGQPWSGQQPPQGAPSQPWPTTPPPAAPTRSKAPFIALAVGVLVVVGGLVAFLALRTESDTIATARAAGHLDTIIAGSRVRAGDNSSVAIESCTGISMDAVRAAAPAGYTVPADKSATAFVVSDGRANDPVGLICTIGSSDDSFETNVGRAPKSDFKGYLTRDLPEFTLTFEDSIAFRGGTILPYCAEPKSDSATKFCESDWFDADIQINVGIIGDQATTDLTTAWLKAALPKIVAGLDADGIPKVVVSTT